MSKDGYSDISWHSVFCPSFFFYDLWVWYWHSSGLAWRLSHPAVSNHRVPSHGKSTRWG